MKRLLPALLLLPGAALAQGASPGFVDLAPATVNPTGLRAANLNKAFQAKADATNPITIGIWNHSGVLNAGDPGAWLATALGFTPSVPAQNDSNTIQSISPVGGNAGLFASRTSDSTSTGNMTPALQVFAFNNNPSQVQSSYGLYGEVRRYAGGGITEGIEINATNYGSVVTVTPYTLGAAGLTAAFWASAGRSDLPGANASPSAVLGVPPSSTPYASGIVFGAGSLLTNYALDMAQGQEVVWHTPTGAVGAAIRSDSATTGGFSQVFTDTGPVFLGSDGQAKLTIGNTLVTTTSLNVSGTVSFASQPAGQTVIAMPKGNLITWLNAAANGYTASIRSDATGPAGALVFADAGITFQASAGTSVWTATATKVSQIATEVTGLVQADAGLSVGGLVTAANNGAAAAAGVPINGVYLLSGTSPLQLVLRTS